MKGNIGHVKTKAKQNNNNNVEKRSNPVRLDVTPTRVIFNLMKQGPPKRRPKSAMRTYSKNNNMMTNKQLIDNNNIMKTYGIN